MKTWKQRAEEMLRKLKAKESEKTHGWEEMVAEMQKRAAKYKGRKENVDYDLLIYGVSRDGTTLEDLEKERNRKKKK